MKKLLIIALTILAGAALQADTITQTNSFDGTPSFNTDLTFSEFDDNSGTYTLDSVIVRLYLTTLAGARLDVDNEDPTATSGTASFGAFGVLSSVDVFLGGAASVTTLTYKAMSLLADDGDGVGVQTTGGDYDFLLATEQSDSNLINVGSGSFFQYIGVGTYDITASLAQEINFGSMGGVAGAFTPLSAIGRVEVEYNYTVPEPATASMLVLAGLIALIARRHLTV